MPYATQKAELLEVTVDLGWILDIRSDEFTDKMVEFLEFLIKTNRISKYATTTTHFIQDNTHRTIIIIIIIQTFSQTESNQMDFSVGLKNDKEKSLDTVASKSELGVRNVWLFC